MKKNKISRYALLSSFFLHSALTWGMLSVISYPYSKKNNPNINTLNLEMFTSIVPKNEIVKSEFQESKTTENNPVKEEIKEVIKKEIKEVKIEEKEALPEKKEIVKKDNFRKKEIHKKEVKNKKIKKVRNENNKSDFSENKKNNITKVNSQSSEFKQENKINNHSNNKVNSNINTQNKINKNSVNNNEIAVYKSLLQKNLQKQALRSYPKKERALNKTGIVEISFNLDANGIISNVKIVNSSGNQALDNAAVNAAMRSSMQQKPPLGFPTNLSLKVKFSLE